MNDPTGLEAPTSAVPSSASSASSSESDNDQLVRLRRFFWGLDHDDPPFTEVEGTEWTPPVLAGFLSRDARSPDPFVFAPGVDRAPPACILLPDLVDDLCGPEAPAILQDNRLRLERLIRQGEETELLQRFDRAREALVAELDLPEAEGSTLGNALAKAAQQLRANAYGNGLLLGTEESSAYAILAEALDARRRRAILAFRAEVHDYHEGLRAVLQHHTSAKEPSAALGGLSDRWMNGAALSGLPRTPRTELPDERRRRIERTVADLAALVELHPAASLLSGGPERPMIGKGVEWTIAEDPLAKGIQVFDREAEIVVRGLRALRVARLELANAFDAARHQPWLDALDWRDLDAREAALLPAVVVRLEAEQWSDDLTEVGRVLRGGRPLILVIDRDPVPFSGSQDAFRLEPASFGLGLREVFVLQGSLGAPEHVVQGAVALAGSGRPALVVLSKASRRPEIPAWLAEAAAVDARAHPLFTYDPEAGAGWARRFTMGPVPEPTLDWVQAPDPEGERLPFTVADLALLGKASVLPVPASLTTDDLVPLAEWLDLPSDRAGVTLPWIAGRDADGTTHRLVVSAALAHATRDQLEQWRSLRELAGIRNEHVERAIAHTREQDEAEWQEHLHRIEEQHSAELAATRGQAVEQAIETLVSALLDESRAVELGQAPPVPARAIAQSPITSTAEAEEAPEISTTSEDSSSSEETAVAEAETDLGEAWIDSELCTSCGDCLARSSQLFAYDENKRAYIKDPQGGTFAQIVEAAENCPARVIHPGAPFDSTESNLGELVSRAAPFQ